MNKFSYLLSILVSMMIIVGSCQKEELTINDQDAYHKKGKKPKVAIYHVTGNGSYHLIYVNENAVPAHLGHGDILKEVDITADAMATNALDLLQNPTAWYFWDDNTDNIDNSIGSFVTGPETPPAGSNSVEISVVDNEKYNLATSQFGGIPLADITSFAFSTYNPSVGNGGDASRSGYLHFNVSFDGLNTWQSRLLYVPRDNGDVDQNTWQEWDAIDGGNALWRWFGYSDNGDTWLDGDSGETKTWDEILTIWPNIKMNGGIYPWMGVRVGEPYATGYTENIDAIKFGVDGIDLIYDFE